MKNQIRIIGGSLRGRKINFPEKKDLRPTPNRVKETLFNWLAPCLLNARCLELFAGSASLSFEAISRHAGLVTAVEKDKEVVTAIKKNAEQFKTNNINIIQADVLEWLKKTDPDEAFDIVFVDPPYALPVLPLCFKLLNEKNWLNKNAYIYFEINHPIEEEELPDNWQVIKNKKAGQVYYYLVQKIK